MLMIGLLALFGNLGIAC